MVASFWLIDAELGLVQRLLKLHAQAETYSLKTNKPSTVIRIARPQITARSRPTCAKDNPRVIFNHTLDMLDFLLVVFLSKQPES